MQVIVQIDESGEIVNPANVKAFLRGHAPGLYSWVSNPAKQRSLSQNRYYFGVCVPMVKEGLQNMGYDEVRSNDDAHEILKGMFLKKKIGKEGEQHVFEVEVSTTDLTTAKFMEYIADIQKFAAEFLNIIIPDPNTQTQLWK